MEKFNKDTFRTSRGLTYTYYHFQGDAGKPTLLMQHGWPDEALLWKDIVPYLTPLGLSILIPDMLGFGETDRPVDPALYGTVSIAGEMMELADHVKAGDLISLGHDWGANIATRLYYRAGASRVKAIISLNVALMEPWGQRFDLKKMNDMLEQYTGFPRMAYWEFLTSPDAEKIVLEHIESFWSLLHQDGPAEAMQDIFCKRDFMREALESDKRLSLRKFAQDPERKSDFIAKARERGLQSGFTWYKAQAENVVYEEEKDMKFGPVEVPFFYLGCDQDGVCLLKYHEDILKKGLLPNCKSAVVSTGHWCMAEKPEEVGPIVAGWLKDLVDV